MPGCHGIDWWTLDPPVQLGDRKIPELKIPVPKGRGRGTQSWEWALEELGMLGWRGVVSHGKYAKPERQGRLGRRWSYFLCWTRLLKKGAEPLGGRWGFREWGVIRAWPQGVANPVYLSLLSA